MAKIITIIFEYTIYNNCERCSLSQLLANLCRFAWNLEYANVRLEEFSNVVSIA